MRLGITISECFRHCLMFAALEAALQDTVHLAESQHTKENKMSQDELKKVKLKVKCRAISEDDLVFDKQDKFCESGSYGKVRRATLKSEFVAIKHFLSAEQKRGYQQELVFLSTLQKHENIVTLHGTGVSKNKPYIVMEFAPYSLEKVLHGVSPRYWYDAGHVLHWSRQLAIGLEYIHDKRILHRDVKASNLLLFGNGSHLKLCDFGTCRNLETNLLYTSNVGTVRYMAPEVIKGEAYTQKCDIFSFAITLWEMLARKVPTVSTNEHHNTFAILFQMAEGKRPPEIVNLPPVIKELINKCWHQDPIVRLPSATLVKKLKKLSSYFPYGNPIVIENLSTGSTDPLNVQVADDCNNGDNDGLMLDANDDDDCTETISNTVVQPNEEPPTCEDSHSFIPRSQSDLTHVQKYLNDNQSQNHQSDHPPVQQQMSVPDLEEKRQVPDLAHGYPPHNEYSPPKNNDSTLIKRECSEVHIDHEVHEVNDPDSDDKRYVSLDENILGFNVRQRYKELEQYYQSQQDSASSLPSSGTSGGRGRGHRSVSYVQPNKADGDSPYAITGLPPELQPVLPDVDDPESLKIYEQYKELSRLYKK